MTVGELIDILQRFEPEQLVEVYDNVIDDTQDINCVELDDQSEPRRVLIVSG